MLDQSAQRIPTCLVDDIRVLRHLTCLEGTETTRGPLANPTDRTSTPRVKPRCLSMT